MQVDVLLSADQFNHVVEGADISLCDGDYILHSSMDTPLCNIQGLDSAPNCVVKLNSSTFPLKGLRIR